MFTDTATISIQKNSYQFTVPHRNIDIFLKLQCTTRMSIILIKKRTISHGKETKVVGSPMWDMVLYEWLLKKIRTYIYAIKHNKTVPRTVLRMRFTTHRLRFTTHGSLYSSILYIDALYVMEPLTQSTIHKKCTFSIAVAVTILHVCSVRSKQADEPRVRDNELVIAYSRWKLTSPFLLWRI